MSQIESDISPGHPNVQSINLPESEPQRYPTRPGDTGDVFEKDFVRLAPRTHDISLAEHHSGIQKLGQDLNEAVQAAWPKRHDVRYLQVHVLLLSWIDDDLGVAREIKGVRHVFRDLYHFNVQEYQIPSGKPDLSLKGIMFQFLTNVDGRENLLIVYYGGHARRALQSNEGSLWFPNRSSPSIAIPSSGIQSMLEEADADVLFLLDCCHSAALPTTDCQQRAGGIVEVIAACGYETIAAEVDQHSFTKTLTDVLAIASKGFPFSIGELHSRVLSRLKCCAPQLATDEEGHYIENTEGRLLYERQPRRTPIYSIICETSPRRSIILGPLLELSSSSSSYSDQQITSSSSAISPPPPASSKKRKLSSSERASKYPQVLLAIRLDDDKFDRKAWIEWIRNAPPEAKDVCIDGAYDSFSTLVLVRMPVAVWDLLPENSAYSFVGFVTSGNDAASWDQNLGISCPCGDVCSKCSSTETKPVYSDNNSKDYNAPDDQRSLIQRIKNTLPSKGIPRSQRRSALAPEPDSQTGSHTLSTQNSKMTGMAFMKSMLPSLNPFVYLPKSTEESRHQTQLSSPFVLSTSLSQASSKASSLDQEEVERTAFPHRSSASASTVTTLPSTTPPFAPQSKISPRHESEMGNSSGRAGGPLISSRYESMTGYIREMGHSWWRCCGCSREVNPSIWGSTCPDCSHSQCSSCMRMI